MIFKPLLKISQRKLQKDKKLNRKLVPSMSQKTASVQARNENLPTTWPAIERESQHTQSPPALTGRLICSGV